MEALQASNGTPSFGNVTFQGETRASLLTLKLDSDFAKSAIHANGTVQLHDDYPADAKLTFANLKYSELRGFLGTDPMVNPNFDALVRETPASPDRRCNRRTSGAIYNCRAWNYLPRSHRRWH